MNIKKAAEQNIWICRHGNRIDFVDPNWEGDDPHLSEDGVIQARETGKRLSGENIRHIFASPFYRTVETAFYIAESLDLQIKIERGVCEWLNAKWFTRPPELMPPEALNERFSRIDLNYRSLVEPEHPETESECYARCLKTAELLLENYRQDFLVIGHGASVTGLARGILGIEEGRPFNIRGGLCALTKIVVGNGRPKMELNGDSSHLAGGA